MSFPTYPSNNITMAQVDVTCDAQLRAAVRSETSMTEQSSVACLSSPNLQTVANRLTSSKGSDLVGCALLSSIGLQEDDRAQLSVAGHVDLGHSAVGSGWSERLVMGMGWSVFCEETGGLMAPNGQCRSDVCAVISNFRYLRFINSKVEKRRASGWK